MIYIGVGYKLVVAFASCFTLSKYFLLGCFDVVIFWVVMLLKEAVEIFVRS